MSGESSPRGETPHELIGRRLLSQTPSLAPLAERIALAAAHDFPVLFTGKTGTGKTYLARLIHEFSARRDDPFRAVLCSVNPAKIDADLFGRAGGPRAGMFSVKGTVVLQQIDTLIPEQQARLARVLESGEYEPVGGNQTHGCAARVLATNSSDLEEAARGGKFRHDLYYRVSIISFRLPPLRERAEDIAPLAREMVARLNARFRRTVVTIHPDALAALEAFPWPGNIHQLEHAIQQAMLVGSGPELLPDHLPLAVRELSPQGDDPARRNSFFPTRDQMEKDLIRRALQASGYSRARAAHALGISRVTLYKKMKKYGLMTIPSR